MQPSCSDSSMHAMPNVRIELSNPPAAQIAVPTSVGYGAAFSGLAPLLSALTAGAPGVCSVNIDNGFGAAMIAARCACGPAGLLGRGCIRLEVVCLSTCVIRLSWFPARPLVPACLSVSLHVPMTWASCARQSLHHVNLSVPMTWASCAQQSLHHVNLSVPMTWASCARQSLHHVNLSVQVPPHRGAHAHQDGRGCKRQWSCQRPGQRGRSLGIRHCRAKNVALGARVAAVAT
jgi:hypothetical protein